MIDDVRLIPNVCVGATKKVRSVCLVTKGEDLADVRSVSLDISSKTSVALTKIIFREFLGFEPEWRDAEPNIDAMLASSDAALIIGDPALSIAECGLGNAERTGVEFDDQRSKIKNPRSNTQDHLRKFDLGELWHNYTGLGFVFAMWMTKKEACPIDFASARDEGLSHADEIAANYASEIGLSLDDMKRYLTENISYSVDESMREGMDLYFELATRHGLIDANKPLIFV